MGINGETSKDERRATSYAEDYEYDVEEFEEDEVEPEDWLMLHSDEIYDGWASLQAFLYDNVLHLERHCNISHFSDLIIKPWLYHTHETNDINTEAWRRISTNPFIKKNVTEGAFNGFMNQWLLKYNSLW